LNKNTVFNSPQIGINPNYNPFDEEKNYSNNFKQNTSENGKDNLDNWDDLFNGIDFSQKQNISSSEQNGQTSFMGNPQHSQFAGSNVLLLKGKFIVTPVKSGLMLINKRRAHERILYEQFMQAIMHNQSVSQVSLFPTTLNMNHEDTALLAEIIDDLHIIGFDIREFGNNTYVVNATPAMFENIEPSILIGHFLEIFRATEVDIKEDAREKIALSLAQAAAIDYRTSINEVEMKVLIDNLFMCETPNYSPSGKSIIQIISMDEIEKKF